MEDPLAAGEHLDVQTRDLLGEAEPRLCRAFIAAFGVERAVEATAEALARGWEHRERLDGG